MSCPIHLFFRYFSHKLRGSPPGGNRSPRRKHFLIILQQYNHFLPKCQPLQAFFGNLLSLFLRAMTGGGRLRIRCGRNNSSRDRPRYGYPRHNPVTRLRGAGKAPLKPGTEPRARSGKYYHSKPFFRGTAPRTGSSSVPVRIPACENVRSSHAARPCRCFRSEARREITSPGISDPH